MQNPWRMNLRHVEAFQAIMASGSATAAGEQLGLSQSAISRMLAQLEEDLGLRLFVRTKGRLVPTREADALAADAQRLVESAHGLQRHSDQLRLGGFDRRLLKVALPNTLASALMPQLARQFMAGHPDAVLEVLPLSYPEAARAVLGRDADVGLVRVPVDVPGLRLEGSMQTDAVCVMPRGHRLQAQDRIGPTDLEDEPLVLLGRRREMRQAVDLAFRQARVLPRVCAEVHSVGAACSFVASGLGLSIVNRMVAAHCLGDALVMRPFEPAIHFGFGVATLEDAPPSPLRDALVALLVQCIGR